jgi:hypothetical protein
MLLSVIETWTRKPSVNSLTVCRRSAELIDFLLILCYAIQHQKRIVNNRWLTLASMIGSGEPALRHGRIIKWAEWSHKSTRKSFWSRTTSQSLRYQHHEVSAVHICPLRLCPSIKLMKQQSKLIRHSLCFIPQNRDLHSKSNRTWNWFKWSHLFLSSFSAVFDFSNSRSFWPAGRVHITCHPQTEMFADNWLEWFQDQFIFCSPEAWWGNESSRGQSRQSSGSLHKVCKTISTNADFHSHYFSQILLLNHINHWLSIRKSNRAIEPKINVLHSD